MGNQLVMMMLALSLKTFSFVMVQVGSQGSHEFIRGFLVPTIFKGSGWPEFQVGLCFSSKLSISSVSSSSWPLASMPSSWWYGQWSWLSFVMSSPSFISIPIVKAHNHNERKLNGILYYTMGVNMCQYLKPNVFKGNNLHMITLSTI